MEVRVGDASEMGNNPASVNLDTHIVTINPTIWENLSPLERKVILLHEYGHIYLDSVTDEIGADRYALISYAGKEKESLRKSVKAFLKIFNQNNISEERKKELLKKALQIDMQKYNNLNAKLLLKKEEFQPRKANFIAYVAAGVALASLGTTYIWGKRSDWAKSGKSGDKTPLREALVRNATKIIIGDIITSYAPNGEQAIYEKIDSSDVARNAHAKLVAAGTFKDNNIFTSDYGKFDKFIKKHNWFRNVIADEIAVQKVVIRQQFANAGYSAPGAKSNVSKWIIGGLGVVLVFILIKKIL